MARVPVHVTPINGWDEVRVHQGEIVAGAVQRMDVDAVVDTWHFYRLSPEAVVEQLGITSRWRGTQHLGGVWREDDVASVL